MEGRLQLLSTVIAGITNFWSCAFILPQACVDEIDSLCSKFLWKGKTDGANAAKVAWAKVTTPKQEGGLDLRKISTWNLASVLKLIWILFFKQESIWSRWYTTEVLAGNLNNLWVINTKQKNSWLANKLLLLIDTACNWIKHLVGNGETTYFWTSHWSPFGNIRKFLVGESCMTVGIPYSITLAELWVTDHWFLPPARSEKQVRIYTFLTSLQLTNSADKIDWCPKGTPMTSYSTRLIYDALRDEYPTVPWHKLVWFGSGIPKHKIRTWLMVLDRCPTRDRMLQWGLQTDSQCLLCNSYAESRSHIYFECDYSWAIWSPLALRCGFTSMRDWETQLQQLQAFKGTKLHRTLLLLAWQGSLYTFWTERNSRLHRDSFRSSYPPLFPRLITPSDEESPLSDPLNQLRLQLYSKCGSLTLLHIDIIDRLNFSLV